MVAAVVRIYSNFLCQFSSTLTSHCSRSAKYISLWFCMCKRDVNINTGAEFGGFKLRSHLGDSCSDVFPA